MSREIARELFASLIKLGDNPWNGYSILNDGNFVKRVYASSDQEAIKEFRNWVDERNKITSIKGEPAEGVGGLHQIKLDEKTLNRIKEGTLHYDTNFNLFYDEYRIDIWQFHKIINTFITNNPEAINEWVKDNHYMELWSKGGCAIFVYKNKVRLSIDEQNNEGITFW